MASIQHSKIEEKTLGQVCYEGYCKQTNNKSLMTGVTLPQWNSMPLIIQYVWTSAAKAVMEELFKIKERSRHKSYKSERESMTQERTNKDTTDNSATKKPDPSDEDKPKDEGKENSQIDQQKIKDNKKWR